MVVSRGWRGAAALDQYKRSVLMKSFHDHLHPPSTPTHTGCWQRTSSSPCSRGVCRSCSKAIQRASGALTVSWRSFSPSSSSWTVNRQNQRRIFDISCFVFFSFRWGKKNNNKKTLLPTAAAEVAPDQDDTVLTSPVRNLQKKTDLFQLQKVLFFFFFLSSDSNQGGGGASLQQTLAVPS